MKGWEDPPPAKRSEYSSTKMITWLERKATSHKVPFHFKLPSPTIFQWENAKRRSLPHTLSPPQASTPLYDPRYILVHPITKHHWFISLDAEEVILATNVCIRRSCTYLTRVYQTLLQAAPSKVATNDFCSFHHPPLAIGLWRWDNTLKPPVLQVSWHMPHCRL